MGTNKNMFFSWYVCIHMQGEQGYESTEKWMGTQHPQLRYIAIIITIFGNFPTIKRWNLFVQPLTQALAMWFALITAHWQMRYKQKLRMFFRIGAYPFLLLFWFRDYHVKKDNILEDKRSFGAEKSHYSCDSLD